MTKKLTLYSWKRINHFWCLPLQPEIECIHVPKLSRKRKKSLWKIESLTRLGKSFQSFSHLKLIQVGMVKRWIQSRSPSDSEITLNRSRIKITLFWIKISNCIIYISYDQSIVLYFSNLKIGDKEIHWSIWVSFHTNEDHQYKVNKHWNR